MPVVLMIMEFRRSIKAVWAKYLMATSIWKENTEFKAFLCLPAVNWKLWRQRGRTRLKGPFLQKLCEPSLRYLNVLSKPSSLSWKASVVMRGLLPDFSRINSIGNIQTKLKPLQKIPIPCCAQCTAGTTHKCEPSLKMEEVHQEQSCAFCFLRSCVAALLLITSSLYEWDSQGEEIEICDRLVDRWLCLLIRVCDNWNCLS